MQSYLSVIVVTPSLHPYWRCHRNLAVAVSPSLSCSLVTPSFAVFFVMQVISCRRSERDGRILVHRLGCNKEGYCVSIRGNFGSVRKPKANTREGCKATIHIKYDKSGKWVITKILKDQNHPLVASPREARQTLEAYVVNNEEGKNSPSSVMPRDKYPNPLIFHDGRLTFLPTPSATLYMFRKLVAHADQQKQEKGER